MTIPNVQAAHCPPPAATKKLVELAPDEQVTILLALDRRDYGGLVPEQVRAIIQALAEYERKQAPAPTRTGQTAIAKLWEVQAGRRLLDLIVESESGYGPQLVEDPLVIGGYKGTANLLVPSPAASLKDFMVWCIRCVFLVETQDKWNKTGWEAKHLLWMWRAYNRPLRENFIDYVKKQRLMKSIGSDYNRTKSKIRMSSLIFGNTYGAERTSKLLAAWRALAGAGGTHYAHRTDRRADDRDAFFGTALHEIAHAVDEKFQITNKCASKPQCGGWAIYPAPNGNPDAGASELISTLLEILDRQAPATQKTAQKTADRDTAQREKTDADAEVYRANHPMIRNPQADQKAVADAEIKQEAAGAKLRACQADLDTATRTDFQDKHGFRREKMETVLEGMLAGQSISDMVLTDDEKATFRAHPISRMVNMMCRDIGSWDSTQAEIEQYAIAGRAYHKAYDKQWVSYLVKSRLHRVTEYQFRHAAEWFADFYAFHHMGLTADHPLEAWMTKVAQLTAGQPVPDPAIDFPQHGYV